MHVKVCLFQNDRVSVSRPSSPPLLPVGVFVLNSLTLHVAQVLTVQSINVWHLLKYSKSCKAVLPNQSTISDYGGTNKYTHTRTHKHTFSPLHPLHTQDTEIRLGALV